MALALFEMYLMQTYDSYTGGPSGAGGALAASAAKRAAAARALLGDSAPEWDTLLIVALTIVLVLAQGAEDACPTPPTPHAPRATLPPAQRRRPGRSLCAPHVRTEPIALLFERCRRVVTQVCVLFAQRQLLGAQPN